MILENLSPKSQLNLAIKLASEKHFKQLDKASRPYILHCLAVMNGVAHYEDDELSAAAVMHDLIEDTDTTIEQLENLGFSSRTTEIVSLLTKQDGESYLAFIQRISTNKDAIRIKLVDINHNLQVIRMECMIDNDCERIRKYHAAYHFLKLTLKELS